jgi:hypothetical protein
MVRNANEMRTGQEGRKVKEKDTVLTRRAPYKENIEIAAFSCLSSPRGKIQNLRNQQVKD